MPKTDLYNASSVSLAEATRIKLYLPGLGNSEASGSNARSNSKCPVI